MSADNNDLCPGGETRRQFIKQTSLAAAAVAGASLLPLRISAAENKSAIAIVIAPSDAFATQPPAQWAAEQLRDALTAHGVSSQVYSSLDEAPPTQHCVLVAGRTSQPAQQILDAAKISLPDAPEALALARGKIGQRTVTLAAGSDARGLVYALLELADRVNFSADPIAVLKVDKPVSEQSGQRHSQHFARIRQRRGGQTLVPRPRVSGRPTLRCWRQTGSTGSTSRFGLGYDFATGLRDTYFYFAYPFFLSVPGYNVRAVPVARRRARFEPGDVEIHQRRDGATRPAISTGPLDARLPMDETARTRITPSTASLPETQGAYCRDALRALLTQCPNITGMTLRTHGESGVPEGDTDIWKTIFDGVAQCGRKRGN